MLSGRSAGARGSGLRCLWHPAPAAPAPGPSRVPLAVARWGPAPPPWTPPSASILSSDSALLEPTPAGPGSRGLWLRGAARGLRLSARNEKHVGPKRRRLHGKILTETFEQVPVSITDAPLISVSHAGVTEAPRLGPGGGRASWAPERLQKRLRPARSAGRGSGGACALTP